MPFSANTEVKGAGYSLTLNAQQVMQVMNSTPCNRSVNVENTTVFGDTQVRKSAGIVDNGDYSFDVVWSSEDHAAIVTAFESGASQAWVATYSDGSTDTFDGPISSMQLQQFDPTTPAIMATITVAVSYFEFDDGAGS